MPSMLGPSVRKPLSACLPSHLHTVPIRFLSPVNRLPEALSLLFLTSFYFFSSTAVTGSFVGHFDMFIYCVDGFDPSSGRESAVRECVCVCVCVCVCGSLWRKMLVSRLPCPLRLKRDSRGGLGLKRSRLCVSPGPDSMLPQHTQEKPSSPTHMPIDHI